MKPITAEWIEKAEGDFRTAGRESGSTDQPNYDAVCFHSQQCAEKYVKAFLVEAETAFPKSHDLTRLLDLGLPIDSSLEEIRPELARLTDYAVEFRYPGQSADRELAQHALEDCRTVRARVRARLSLPQD